MMRVEPSALAHLRPELSSCVSSQRVHFLTCRCRLYNLNIANTYGTTSNHTQAIALSVQAGTFACYACQLKGIQDTLLANEV